MLCRLMLVTIIALLGVITVVPQDAPKPIKVGIIGCDTSHCIAFTKILNNPKNMGDLAGLKVVAAFPGGSSDLTESIDRVAGYVDQLKKEFNVEIVTSIPDLLNKVDAILLESVDGRTHLEQARAVFKSGKPVFIDKPLAASLADGISIFKLAESAGIPCFSSSALRFTPNIAGAQKNDKLGKVVGCLAYSPCHLNKFHPDLYWYGIHGVETLFTIMGTGCETVQRSTSEGTDIVTGIWRDGRIGTFRGIRQGKGDFGALVFGDKGSFATGTFTGYEPLVIEIARFFRSRKAPVSPAETLEILAFMSAADESKKAGGALVRIDTIMSQAAKEMYAGSVSALRPADNADNIQCNTANYGPRLCPRRTPKLLSSHSRSRPN